MNIILLGAPGTGKGTQGKFIIKKYSIPHISAGDILRENICLGGDLGNNIKKSVLQGKLVDDNIICDLIEKRIHNKDCCKGFLFDGFPRNIQQAQYIFQKNIKIDYVLELLASRETVIERISGRRIHPSSGRIYHIKFNPPKIQDIDDITGEKLHIRKDDTIKIIKKRLKEYEKITQPLIKYYQQEHKKNNLKYFQIDSSNQLLKIKKIIFSILEKK